MTAIPMGDLLRHHTSLKASGTLVLAYPNARFGWDDLEAATNRRARLYQSLGVGEGDRVAIALGNGTAFHEAAFAVWKLGATPATLSPKLSANEFAALTTLIEPKLLLKQPSEIDAALPVTVVGPDADFSGFSPEPFPSAVAPVWKLSSSGGSTGRPKIIVHDSPAMFDPATTRIRDEFLLQPGAVLLNPGPLYHNAPFLFSSYAIFTGGSVIGMERFDAEEALRLIEQHRVNWVNLVPTMMHRIWSLPEDVRKRYDLTSLGAVWHMASACPAWLKDAWLDWIGPDRLWERYGGTESFGSTVISGPDWLTHRGSVGRVVNNARMKVVREDGTLCAPGEIGELFFRPAAEKPPARYIGAEANRDNEGYYSMGDLGHVDEEGFLYIADRRTDLIVRGGANIYPAEIEAALDAHPDIASAVVIGLPDDELGARVHAIVQAKPEVALDLCAVHDFITTQVAKYKLPESYEIASDALRDEAGKVRRTALRDERIAWLETDRAFKVSARSFQLKPSPAPIAS